MVSSLNYHHTSLVNSVVVIKSTKILLELVSVKCKAIQVLLVPSFLFLLWSVRKKSIWYTQKTFCHSSLGGVLFVALTVIVFVFVVLVLVVVLVAL